MPLTGSDFSLISTALRLDLKFAAETLDYSIMQGIVMKNSETWSDIATTLNDVLQGFQSEHIAQLCIMAKATLKIKIDRDTEASDHF